MPTVSGTFLRSDGTPSSGSVAFAPSVAIGDAAEVRLPAPCEVHLDATGSFEVTLPATDDPDYTPTGWVWQVRERIAGGRDAWYFELTADTDYWNLATVLPPDDYLPWTFTASATTGLPGTDADVDVSNVGPAVAFAFDIPRGDPGPTTDLSVGTVTTGAPGSSASADITGTPPTLALDLTIPRGDVGATGPANELTIGTVTTGAAGSSAAATITGTPPSQTLALTIPRGDTGATGMPSSLYDAKGDLIAATANDTPARVAVGNNGTLLVADSTASTGVAWRAPSPITASAIGVTLDRANPVYSFTSGSVTATLPSAATHTGVRFLVRNAGSGTVTVSGITGLTIPGTGYVDVVSDGSAWVVLEGAYATSAVGLASYRWNQANAAWRLIAYDSGVRNVLTLAGTITNMTVSVLQIQRVNRSVEMTLRAQPAAATAGILLTWADLGAGWAPTRAQGTRQSFVFRTITDADSLSLYLDASRCDLIATAANAAVIDIAREWKAGSALPAALPGTQVTAPV